MSLDLRIAAFLEERADEGWERAFSLPLKEWSALTPEGEAARLIEVLDHPNSQRELITHYLKRVDLIFGAETEARDIEEPKWAEVFLKFLFETFVPEIPEKRRNDPWMLATEDYIHLFERLSLERLQIAIEELKQGKMSYEYSDMADPMNADWILDAVVTFVREMRPAVKACKEKGAHLIWESNRETDAALLETRATRHLEAILLRYPDVKKMLDARA